MKFSTKCSQIQSSVTLAIDAKAKAMKAQGEDVVSFGAGEPDFATPAYIIEAAKQAMDEGKTKYTPASGLIPLRQAIAEKTKQRLGLDYEFDQIVVSNGAKQALFNALQVLCDPGDEVIIFAPYWVSYPELVKMADATPVFVPTVEEQGFTIDFDALEKAITPKTKALILNSPTNPTGVVVPEEDIRRIGALAVKHDFMIISDEIYDMLVYEDAKHFSVAQISEEVREHTILVNGMSKSYAMTGWRVGYSLSSKPIAKMIGSFQSHATGNTNTIAQYATLAALTQENPAFDGMLAEFDRRRRFMLDTIAKMENVSAVKPRGAFYVMLDISKVLGKAYHGKPLNDSLAFASVLLDETRTAVVPGGPFGAAGYVRLSYATDMETIRKGLERIAAFVKEVK